MTTTDRRYVPSPIPSFLPFCCYLCCENLCLLLLQYFPSLTMRDHFDPSLDMGAGPLVFASQQSIPPAPPHTQHVPSSEYAMSQQSQHHPPMMSLTTAGTGETFDYPVTSPGSSSAPNAIPSSESPVPFAIETLSAKRHVSEILDESSNSSSSPLDCQSLQSSLKRVKLSCSPGELRLQRDLKMLPQHEWQQVSGVVVENNGRAASPTNNINATWVHAATGARLTLVDSLRLCLFLPKPSTTTTQNELQQPHHQHSQWRMMIQIPRMFPHRPPVLSRIEGNLSVQQVIIHEAPPVAVAGQSTSEQEDGGNSSIMGGSTTASTPTTTTTSSPQPQREPLYDALTSTIVWNKWSVVSNLSDLLDFLLDLATSLDTNTSAVSSPPYKGFPPSRLVSDESTAAWPTSLSSSSASSWTTGSAHQQDSNNRELHFYMEEHKFDDPTTTTTATIPMSTGDGSSTTTAFVTTREPGSSGDGSSIGSRNICFLPPNRFDVGYEKYNNGNAVGFVTAAVAAGTTLRRLESFDDDSVMMDMNE